MTTRRTSKRSPSASSPTRSPRSGARERRGRRHLAPGDRRHHDGARRARGVKVITGLEGTYEHVDLQFDKSKNGHFTNPQVREAFMKIIPRQEIVDTLIKPIIGDEAHRAQLADLRARSPRATTSRSPPTAPTPTPMSTSRAPRRSSTSPASPTPRSASSTRPTTRVVSTSSRSSRRPRSGRLQRHRLRHRRVGRPARHPGRLRRVALRMAVDEPRCDEPRVRRSRPAASTT